MFDGCEDYEEDGMEGAEVRCCEEVQSSMNLSQPDECTGDNRDASKRLSKDSGTGSDIEQDSLRSCAQKTLAAAGRASDSGEEEACDFSTALFVWTYIMYCMCIVCIHTY